MKGKNRNIKISQVYDINNIIAADLEARKGKQFNYGVLRFDKRREYYIQKIHKSIKDGTYHTGKVTFERRFCDKKFRILSKVHYYDHVAHHALMRVIMPVIHKSYYNESAASIKGRGIHYLLKHMKKFVQTNKDKDMWFSQIDFVKCYHHVNRQRLYDRLCKTFADEGIRNMLHDVIWALGDHNGLHESDGTEGVGIGLYPIQPLVNYYMNDMDREICKVKGIKMYRYLDNIYLIGFSTKAIKEAISVAKNFISLNLDQPIHENIGIQKIDNVHFVDAIGYKIYKDHVLVRSQTKYRFKRKCKKQKGKKRLQMLASYKGWLQYCNGLHLWQKTTNISSYRELDSKRYGKTNIRSTITE